MEYDFDQAKSDFQVAKEAYETLYEDCKEDWEFLHGINQWEAKDVAKRRKQGRPALTLNQLLPYAQQVINDIRQSRLAIRVSPVDDNADVDTAEVFQGIIRNIERTSGAQNVYATAAMNAVGAGIGWIRLRVDYADTDTFNQEIFVERVLDFSSVYLDPNSKEIDGSDAEFAFIRVDYKKERFEELYPDAMPVSFDEEVGEDNICVVEYYKKHYKKDTIYRIVLVDGSEQILTKEQKDILDEDGTVDYAEIESRDVEIPYVKHCVLNGEEEPIEESEFPSKYIPIIPVIGEEVYIDNKREFHSLIRQGKDGQKMYNYANTANTELMGLQPKTPWVGAIGSFKSYANKWKNANTENFSHLEYDIVFDKNGQRVEPPQRSQPVQGSMGWFQMAQSAKEDIRQAIGMPNANMGMQGNEVSGIAIRNRQIEGDNATFHFIDNLSSSIAYAGVIMVDLIPRLYSKRKIARILGEDDAEKNVPINVPFVKEAGNERPARQGEKYDGIYDLGAGKYDVVCDVGASYSSKRQEESDKLIEVVQAQPELFSVVGDLLFKALDLPNGKEISERLRANMPPEMLGEDPMAEKLKQAAQQLAAMEEQLKNYDAALQDKSKDAAFEQKVKLEEIELDRQKVMNETQKTQAEIEKMRAETTGFNIEAVSALGNAVTALSQDFADVKEAMEIMLDAKEMEALEEANEATGEPIESPEQPMEGET